MEELRNDTRSDHSKNYYKRHWKDEEDKLLYGLVEENGPRNWNSIAKHMQGRSGKSCRLRWVNQLAPHVKRTPLSGHEQLNLLNLHRIHGNRWSTIALHFPGRTDNQLKNHFHAIMARNRRLFSDLSRSLVAVNNDQLVNAFTNALLEQIRTLRLPNSSHMENILHGVQSHKLADYFRYIMGNIAQFAKEKKSFPPRAEGYNVQEKNFNPVLRMGKPVTLYDMFQATKPQSTMTVVQDQKEMLVQKKPVQFIDFLGVGNVE